MHRLRRQGRQRDALRGLLRREIAKRQPERVRRRESVIAVGEQQQGRRAADPPAEEAEQVEGRLVGPVNVLDDHDVEVPGLTDLSQERVEEFPAVGAVAAQFPQLSAEVCGQIEQWSERTGGGQAVTCAPRPPCAAHVLLGLSQ